MRKNKDQPSLAALKEENERLRASLEKCQSLVDLCRDQLKQGGEASFLIDPPRRAKSPPPDRADKAGPFD